jgi:hypothetical protein
MAPYNAIMAILASSFDQQIAAPLSRRYPNVIPVKAGIHFRKRTSS